MAPAGRVLRFPDVKPADRRSLLGPEIGTTFDYGQRLFAYFGSGDVFDYGEWKSRDMSQMLVRDGQAAALESVLTLPIRQAKWAIEPHAKDRGEADFVHDVLVAPREAGGMTVPMREIIGQLTSAQIYRKAFFEKVWEIRPGGKVGYSKLAFRPTATCEVKRNAKTAVFDGFRQQVWLFGGVLKTSGQRVPGYVDIPVQRSYVYIHGKHREPLTGTSELDLCYWCYQTKLKLLFLWYNFLEQQSLPKVITYGQDQPEANSRADDVASMRQSAVVGWVAPRDGSKAFDVLETSGKGAEQFNQALTFLETWQTSSVLAGFTGLASLASLGRGSMALSQDQSAFFLKSREAVVQEIQSSITHDVIAPLVLYNFGRNANYPKFKFGPLTEENMQSIVGLFQAMSVAPALQVPPGFLDILTERVATVLDLDVNAVHKIVMAGAKERAQQAQQQAPPGVPPQAAAGIGALTGGVNAATRITQQAIAQSTRVPLPEQVNQPFSVPQLGFGAGRGV